jgi:hypothetical protein
MYTIPEEIKKIGINREMIDYHFSKTKMKDFEIEQIEFVKIMNDASVLIRLKIFNPNSPYNSRSKFRNIVIQISKGKIRDNKINKLLNE